MVYGIAKMLNFAHGDIIMVGAYIALMSMTQAGLPPFAAVLVAVVGCTVLGVLIERIAYKPLRNASSSLAVLITAIGVSYLLQNLALLIFGANTQTFSSVVKWKGVTLADGAMSISGVTIVTIVVCIIIMAVLVTSCRSQSRAGQCALSPRIKGQHSLWNQRERHDRADFCDRFRSGSDRGVLLCSAYPSLTPYTGAMPVSKLSSRQYSAGSARSREHLSEDFSLGSSRSWEEPISLHRWADALVFAVLIIVLLVKPTGILGKQIQEKV